ncbi:Ribose-phosphate pyrophosphokinase [Durusdinium trenchii]|uniref:Ribose-phosphate pyrophosphokinase n=1 Tax=Durusdinium trenchii TaxID=1381693 RepID=A0ABP0HRY3_9DINO
MPGLDLELLGQLGESRFILQAASYVASLPILPLLQLSITATTPILDGFSAQLQLEIPNASFTDVLDVSLPVGLFVDTCSPVCLKAPQSDASPEPVWRFFGMDEVTILTMELYASSPLSAQNFWRVILRDKDLQATSAVTLQGFSVAYSASLDVDVSSQRAGSLFSKMVLTFALTAGLPAGALLYIQLPAMVSEPQEVEPGGLFQHASSARLNMTNAVLFITVQSLSTGVNYAISFPMVNPILSPESNHFILQTYLPELQEIHSIGTSEGYQVYGEFESFGLLSMSSVPEILTPSMIQFRLRTPFPSSADSVQLRLVAEANSFDAQSCIVDVLKPGTSLPKITSILLMPDDCLVDADGARADYMFARVFLAKTNYYFWIYTLNPISQTRTYAASTIFNDQRVHETSFRSSRSQLLGAVIPGSYAANVTHRAVLKIFSASGLQGQRGSLELQLPRGFGVSCEDFRPRGTLPTTARCRTLQETESSGARLQIYWRSLFGESELKPPFEVAFTLMNSNTTGTDTDDSDDGWMATMYEGENQDFAVDFSGHAGLKTFAVCPAFLEFSLRREDAFTISIVMRTGVDVPAAFDILFRVELRSSLSAPAEVYCPETSVWQPREELVGHVSSTAQGLPRYTVCVQEPRATTPADYLSSASQHISAVLFHLPYSRFYGQQAESQGLEVRMQRSQMAFAPMEPSPNEALAERVNVNLESQGQRISCASLPLGQVALVDASSTDPTGDLGDLTADVAGSSATG